MGLNDSAWERLFDKYSIIHNVDTNGKFIISAEQIKEFREPRLMTKFDHKRNLPCIFRDNNLSILPLSRSEYIISSFDAYKELEEPCEDIQSVYIPEYLQSLAPDFLISETIALNCASSCGILEDFLEDTELMPTVSGRMGSDMFDFVVNSAIGTQCVRVSNSQIEIDAAYEGINYLSIFEAKNTMSKDFLIRQLYYPFRTWSNRISKPIKTIFHIFSNGTFYLYQYCFLDPKNYNSLQLVKQKNYMIATKISLMDIENVIRTTCIIHEPEIPFPQADSMPRIINMLELLTEKTMTKGDITKEYLFEERQTNYYADAARYLGFVNKEEQGFRNISYALSDEGRSIMKMAYKERLLAIVTQILKHRIFNETLRLHLQSGAMPDKDRIMQIMREANAYRVCATSTYFRRASTVVSWVNWILSIIEE